MNSLHTSPSLEINGSPLNRVNYTKSLGFLIDEKVWRNYIDAISKKISSGIGSIKEERHCTSWTLLNIYHDLAQSHFDYCVVWGSCGKVLSIISYKNSKIVQLVYSPFSNYDAEPPQLLGKLSWENRDSTSDSYCRNSP